MTDQFCVAIIGSPFLPNEFAMIAIRAEVSGFRVLHYKNFEAFCGDAEEHKLIDVVLCMGNCSFGVDIFARMPRLRGLISAVTGVEGFDIEAATTSNIMITNGQTELNYMGMAEATIMMILAMLYDFNFTQSVLKDNLNRPSPLRARMLRCRTLGFIGFGRIAQEVALRLQGWNVKMSAYVHRDNSKLEELGVARTDLNTLLGTADVVSLNCSLNETTRHIINADRLRLMRPDAILINAGRGALIDEKALYQALSTGMIHSAALDVFEEEPLPINSPLRALPNVILTPHMVGHTRECNETLMETAWEAIVKMERGELSAFIKNPEVIMNWTQRYRLSGVA